LIGDVVAVITPLSPVVRDSGPLSVIAAIVLSATGYLFVPTVRTTSPVAPSELFTSSNKFS
jgi:hypothetical protein